MVLPEHGIGEASAPIQVDEFASITCSHCAHFFLKTLPLLEERYVKTGKVRFVLHNYPLDGFSLKAAAVAECMPKDEFFPFIKTLYSSLLQGLLNDRTAERKLYQYAALGGLAVDKAKACANDTKIQDAIIAERTRATAQYDVRATPTFVVNDGVEIISGAQDVEAFAAIFDRLLTTKKK
ncbi:MAG: thioredoxin domain-containing protein [Alphaproteobacteria bacterium]|nr:thioredoxin domain-containing protein [Alphaproteobacteria bacterium]